MIQQIAIRGFDKNFSYLIFDRGSGVAAVVDPDDLEKIDEVVLWLGVELKVVLITHSHFDHVGGVKELAEREGLAVFMHKNAVGKFETGKADVRALEDGEEFEIGAVKVKVIHTPGHIDDAVCYLVDNESLICGDTLFVEGCGRAANVEDLWESLQRLKELDDEVKVCPGHDYGSKPVSTIGYEKEHNKYLLCSDLEEFIRVRM